MAGLQSVDMPDFGRSDAAPGPSVAPHPAAWERIQARRRFMIDVLGIDLDSAVLPFSNIPAYVPPFLLPRLWRV